MHQSSNVQINLRTQAQIELKRETPTTHHFLASIACNFSRSLQRRVDNLISNWCRCHSRWRPFHFHLYRLLILAQQQRPSPPFLLCQLSIVTGAHRSDHPDAYIAGISRSRSRISIDSSYVFVNTKSAAVHLLPNPTHILRRTLQTANASVHIIVRLTKYTQYAYKTLHLWRNNTRMHSTYDDVQRWASCDVRIEWRCLTAKGCSSQILAYA